MTDHAPEGPIDLSDAFGVGATLDPMSWTVQSLEFCHEAASYRWRRELEPYLLHPSRLGPGLSYVMLRDLRRTSDEVALRRRGVQVDLTILEAEPLAEEYNKTLGHFHPTKPGTDLTYPELYAVLAGSGVILLEHRHQANVIDDVLLVELFSGQYLLIPPGYGHLTINLGPDRLILMNVVAREFISDYSEFAEHHGAAYHLMVGQMGPRLESSEAYRLIAPARWVVPREVPLLGLHFFEPIYPQVVKSQRLHCLTQPERCLGLWQGALFEQSDRQPVRPLRHRVAVRP